MRYNSLHYTFFYCLLMQGGFNSRSFSSSSSCIFAEAQTNVFLRGASPLAGANENGNQQGVSCPGVHNLDEFPVVTGGSTTMSAQRQSASSSSSSITSDGSMAMSQEVLYKCSDDRAVLEAPGVWYRLEGMDASIHASLLFDTQSDQRMAIFEAPNGGGCNPSQCLMVSNGFQTQLDWFAESSSTYFIKVYAVTSEESGPFVLHMEVCSILVSNLGIIWIFSFWFRFVLMHDCILRITH